MPQIQTLLILRVAVLGKTTSKDIDVIDVSAETSDIHVRAFALRWG